MRLYALLLGAASLAFSTAGHAAWGTEPIVDYEPSPIRTADGSKLSDDDAADAVLRAAGSAMGWTVRKTGPKKLQATATIGSNGSATAEIEISGSMYSIRYLDSTGLRYDAQDRSIHKNYNAWVKRLRLAIDNGILVAEVPKSQPEAGAASPPAAPPPPDPMKDVRIGVAMTPLPKVSAETPGAGCLLCLAAAQASLGSLSLHLQSLPTDDLLSVKEDLAERLRKRGARAVAIKEALDLGALADFPTQGGNVAKKDFTALKQKYDVDKLLVIEIGLFGVTRNYSAYIPRGDPRAFVNSTAYVVNLGSNVYESRMPVNITKAAEGTWDEPPKFPGMTNAWFQVIELARDRYLKEFE